MEERGAMAPMVIAAIVVTSLLSGCLSDDGEAPDPNPKAVLTGPSEAWVGEVVDFDATGSRDRGTEFEILNFSWEMGDNTTFWGKPFVSGWIASPNHTYEHEGTYLVNLTVTDTWGNQGHANLTILVRYQLNMTVNARGTWVSEDSLNNTTYFNLTVQNVWTGLFDVPQVRIRMVNETGGEVAPRAQTGDAVPANLTAGESFTLQVHFAVPPGFEAKGLTVTEELYLDLTGGA